MNNSDNDDNIGSDSDVSDDEGDIADGEHVDEDSDLDDYDGLLEASDPETREEEPIATGIVDDVTISQVESAMDSSVPIFSFPSSGSTGFSDSFASRVASRRTRPAAIASMWKKLRYLTDFCLLTCW